MTKNFRFKFGKLVRDKIPSLIEESDITVFTKKLSDEEYRKQLKGKLLEEVQEVSGSNSKEQLTEEFADILEILESLASAYDIPWQEVLTQKNNKKAEKGAFDERVFAVSVEIAENNPALSFYRSQPDKYPPSSE